MDAKQSQKTELKSEFVIWRYKDTPGACALKELRGLDKAYRLNNGTSLAAGFPAGVTVHKAQSIFEASLLDDDDIDSFERLVLNESAIPGDRHLFRLKGFWNITLVRRSLAEALTEEKFSGLSWLEIDAYPEV